MTVLKKSTINQGKQWPQILAIFSASLVTMLSGVLFAWPSPFIIKITQDESYSITEDQASWFTVLHPVGMCLFCPLFVKVPNIIGRKKSLILAAVPLTTSLIIKAFVKNVWVLYISRLLGGIGDAMIFCSLPAYIGEVSVPQVRGVYGNLFTICLFFGQFIVNVVGSYFSVQNTSLIFTTIPIIFLTTFIFMPESPYYLVMVGKNEEAKKNLAILRRMENVDYEFADVKLAVEKQTSEFGSLKDLFIVKANRKALTAGLFLRISQALSGVYAFVSYTQFIFQKAGGNIEPTTSAMLQTGLTLIMYICASYGSNILGRRKAFISSIFLSAVVLLCEATYFYIDSEVSQINLESINWFPLAGMLIFVVVSSFGVGIIPTLMTTELFSTSIKPLGVSAVTIAFALTNILVNFGFYYLNVITGLYGPFLFFCICNFSSAVIAYFLVPETKGKTLEEIQEMLRNK